MEKCEESVFHTPGQMNQENQKGFGPLDKRGGVGGGGGGGSGLQGLMVQVWAINHLLQDCPSGDRGIQLCLQQNVGSVLPSHKLMTFCHKSYCFHAVLCLHVTRCYDTERKTLAAVQRREESWSALRFGFMFFHKIYYLHYHNATTPLGSYYLNSFFGRGFSITKDF